MARRLAWVLAGWLISAGLVVDAYAESGQDRWIRGSLYGEKVPLWGHSDGLRVGLAPLGGPRGLLRIYAPYLGHLEGRVINFIAVEPIPHGTTERGLSELEFSRLDDVPGKRFWSMDNPNDAEPRPASEPIAGFLEHVDGEERLCVYIGVERFENDAHVYLKLTFRADRPHELGIATYVHKDSQPLAHCIVTATMGNYARLRHLQLADRTVAAGDLWPDYRGDGFSTHAKFPLSELIRTPAGHATAIALPDEEDPSAATYAPGTRWHWQYRGQVGRQVWTSANPHPELEVWVNGRYTYWASQHPIPGGISFENFEMVAPFRQGEEFIFSIEPISPDPISKAR